MKPIKEIIYTVISNRQYWDKYEYIDIESIIKIEVEVESKIPVLIIPVMRSIGILP
jgi:hypothetical protein